ncbi:MAG: site-specific DNA-methyltransferase, partial [Nitrospirota bacterium]
ADFNGGPHDFEQKVEFYHHEQNWSNRLILGDSLLAMTSLAEKEGLKGKVQSIYLDPPYGIKFGSNWQVSTRKRDVKDGKAEDATRQPEQVRAFRDTWKLGIHSYLAYLRDRLLVARDLLTETGSMFVQISDENVHLVRNVMDEVFGPENFVAQIAFKKTAGASGNLLSSVFDYLLWFSKEKETLKYRPIFKDKMPGEKGAGQYDWIDLEDGTLRQLGQNEEPPHGARLFAHNHVTSQRPAQGADLRKFEVNGITYTPGAGTFKSDLQGLTRLRAAKRLFGIGKSLRYIRYLEDFPVFPLSNFWDDTGISGFADQKTYVVQTLASVIERCLLMTTDPGDLVFDPTCGSGTTAYVAEQWGRRWITCDTSRVALALARTRLMAAKYPYYLLADSREGIQKETELTGKMPPEYKTEGDIKKGFVYKRVPHVTLKSIANNPDIKEGMARKQIDAAIAKHA